MKRSWILRDGPESTAVSAAAPLPQAAQPAVIDTLAPVPRSALGQVVDRVGNFWTLAVLIIIIIIFGVISTNYFSQANWLATSVYSTEILLLALGQTFVIITAGIDLSVGAVLAFSAMAGGLTIQTLMNAHWSSGLAVTVGYLVSLATGVAVGLVNGLAITRLKLTPFIVTLGTLGMCTGAADLLYGGNEVSDLPPQVGNIGNTVLGGWFPIPVIVTAVLFIIFGLLLAKTRFGVHTYAIGSNNEAARRSGIHVDRHLLWVYVLSGVLAAVAGILVFSRFTVASPIYGGGNEELDAIAGVVIGGTSLFGGSGNVFGTLVGGLIISVIETGLVLANVQPFWQVLVVGLIIILAVYIDQTRDKLRDR